MTKAGKALVVFITFASVAFMGFAAVTSLGGTNWKEYLAEKRYQKSTKTLSEVVKEQDAEILRLQKEFDEIEAALTIAKQTKESDIAAMKTREDALVAQIAELNQQIIDRTKESSVIGNEAIAVENELTARHEEVVRLRNQLKEIRSQIVVAHYEMERLDDRVIQAKELLKYAQRRNRRLKSE